MKNLNKFFAVMMLICSASAFTACGHHHECDNDQDCVEHKDGACKANNGSDTWCTYPCEDNNTCDAESDAKAAK